MASASHGKRVFLLLLLLFSCVLHQAHAQLSDQPPPLPREFIDEVRRLEGDSLNFCVYADSVTVDLDKSVATAIGDALLLDIEIIPIEGAISIPGLDFVPLSEEELYIYLSNECDAFMGFSLAPAAYPEWLTFTRSYVQTDFVAFTHNSSIQKLSDLAPGGVIGTVMLTEGDAQIGSLISSQSEDTRWRRFPYPHTRLLLERVLDGTVDVAITWEPALAYELAEDDGDVQLVSTGSFALPRRQLGIALSSADSYYRNSLDFAIDELISSGQLNDILEAVAFPGEAPVK